MAEDTLEKRSYRREVDELAERRREAMVLLEEGMVQSDVAREIGVSRQTVSRWAKLMAAYPNEQPWRRRPLGRPGRLSREQKMELLRELSAHYQVPSRAKAEGSWSLERVAQLIEQRFGVSYSLGQVSTMLKELVGCPWSNGRGFWVKVRKLAYPKEGKGAL